MDALPTNRTWPSSRSHGTYQHKAITSRSRQLLMIGTWLPETCWATIRRKIIQKVTSSWFFLSTLNYDARSTTHQIQTLDCVGNGDLLSAHSAFSATNGEYFIGPWKLLNHSQNQLYRHVWFYLTWLEKWTEHITKFCWKTEVSWLYLPLLVGR